MRTIACFLCLLSCISPSTGQDKTLYEILTESDKFSGVVRALNSTEPNLLDAMKNDRRQFTIFAPNDEAYAQSITPDLRDKLLSDGWDEHRQTWIRFHVLSSSFPTSRWGSRPGVVSLSGLVLNLTATTVNGLTPITPDVMAVNGVLHEMPAVFEHRFLSRTIWKAASDAPSFSTVVELTEKVGLVGLADGIGPNTILVPTNAAFEVLATKINLQDSALVKKIFEYHVIPDVNIYAQNVMPGDALQTLQGEPLMVTEMGINGAPIETANIVMSNGVVHTIQDVLIPPSIQTMIDAGTLTNTTPPAGPSSAGQLTLTSSLLAGALFVGL